MTAVGAAAAFLLAVGVAALPGASADMDDIDCATSQFSFAAEGYNVDCQRSTEPVRAGQSSGATQVDVITISAEDPRVFMTVVAIRISATRLYLEHRSLRENFRETFSHIEAENWEGLGNKDGYDSAEFTATISGLPSSCVAIQRYSNPAWTGYKRRLVGMGCSTTNRDAVYAALAKLHAPGD